MRSSISRRANASEKGRRTVYSYFRTKREIYEAVIEDESRQVRDLLRREVATPTANTGTGLPEWLPVVNPKPHRRLTTS